MDVVEVQPEPATGKGCCGTCRFWYFNPNDPSAFHYGECCYCSCPIPASAGNGRKCSCWEKDRDIIVSDEQFKASFERETGDAARLSRRMVIMLCIEFHWSELKVIRRAEALGLTKRGTWQWFNDNDWFTKEHWDQAISEQEF